jgi:hypothetical protein
VPDGFNISLWQRDLPSARSLASASVNGSTIVYVGSAPRKGLGKVRFFLQLGTSSRLSAGSSKLMNA